MRVPTLIWSHVVRGSDTPAAPQAAWVSPEQSKESGPVAPHTYGLPSCALRLLEGGEPLPLLSRHPVEYVLLLEVLLRVGGEEDRCRLAEAAGAVLLGRELAQYAPGLVEVLSPLGDLIE